MERIWVIFLALIGVRWIGRVGCLKLSEQRWGSREFARRKVRRERGRSIQLDGDLVSRRQSLAELVAHILALALEDGFHPRARARRTRGFWLLEPGLRRVVLRPPRNGHPRHGIYARSRCTEGKTRLQGARAARQDFKLYRSNLILSATVCIG